MPCLWWRYRARSLPVLRGRGLHGVWIPAAMHLPAEGEEVMDEIETVVDDNRGKENFEIIYNGRAGLLGQCWRVMMQEYDNCEISAGIVSGLEPDVIYLRFDKDESTTILLRKDEALAIVYVLSGTLWSSEIDKLITNVAPEPRNDE